MGLIFEDMWKSNKSLTQYQVEILVNNIPPSIGAVIFGIIAMDIVPAFKFQVQFL